MTACLLVSKVARMTLLITFMMLGCASVIAFAMLFRRPISYWRWLQLRREFLAHWGRQPLSCQQHAVVLAWSLCEWPNYGQSQLQPLMEQALDEHWLATQYDPRCGGDLVVLGEDMARLIEASASGF